MPPGRISRFSAANYGCSRQPIGGATDAVLAGLAYQYANEQSRHVAVLASDRLAEQAIADVLGARGVDEETAVVEGRTFLSELRGQDHDR